MPNPTPTLAVIERIATFAKDVGLTESDLCVAAKIAKSTIGVARKRGGGTAGGIGWNKLSLLILYLEREYGASRDWFLWKEGNGPFARVPVRVGADGAPGALHEVTERPTRGERKGAPRPSPRPLDDRGRHKRSAPP